MKRTLPLILALVVGMAQTDSNSDYRVGFGFARQTQGQGIDSIRGFRPQESIPSYDVNSNETKYHGGVTAGEGGGLKSDGITEWATGEIGETIIESFVNKPKGILSSDAPFIQTGRDVTSRADSIVGNTGQRCSAQGINCSEFTNYIRGRDTMVEEYYIRTTSITGDRKYTDEYHEVTIPYSQPRSSTNGLKLVLSVMVSVTSAVENASSPVYAAFFFLNSRYTFMSTTFNVGLTDGQPDTYLLSGAIGLQVTQGQALTGSGCTANGNCLPYGNGDRKVYESLVSGASTFVSKLRTRVRDKEQVPRVEQVESCSSSKADGVLTDTECLKPGGMKTGVMEGKPWSIAQAYWACRDKYATQSADNGICQKYVGDPAYTLASRQCAFYFDEGTYLHEYATYFCEFRISGEVMVCDDGIFCPDGECDKVQSGKSSDSGGAASQLAVFTVADKDVATLNGMDVGASTGEAKFCRKAAAGFSNRCEDDGWGQDMGLAKCNSEEKALGRVKDNKLTVSVGELCPKKMLGARLQKKRSYYQFDSKLAQTAQQQEYNEQLRIEFGSAKHLDCRGIMVDELQRIKFDKLDFTDFCGDLMRNQKVPDSDVLMQKAEEQIADQLKQVGR